MGKRKDIIGVMPNLMGAVGCSRTLTTCTAQGTHILHISKYIQRYFLHLTNGNSSVNSYTAARRQLTFRTYIMAIREVRNACAHGNVLFGLTLSKGIRTGAAYYSFSGNSQQNFNGALRVIDYLLRRISLNRANDMWNEIYAAARLLYSKAPSLKTLIETQTGIVLPICLSK